MTVNNITDSQKETFAINGAGNTYNFSSAVMLQVSGQFADRSRWRRYREAMFRLDFTKTGFWFQLFQAGSAEVEGKSPGIFSFFTAPATDYTLIRAHWSLYQCRRQVACLARKTQLSRGAKNRTR